MEEIYDLHQYTHLVALYIQKTKVCFDYYSTITRSFRFDNTSKVKDTCITYDKQKLRIKSWGNKKIKSKNKDDVRVDNFRDKLYQVFKNDNDSWDQDDLLLLKAVSDFTRLLVEQLVGESGGDIKGTDKLHYAFVVPSEWEEEIRETLIRPIFVQSNLISNNDHNDRLLFCSDIECIFYNSMNWGFDFEKRKKSILCRLCPVSASKVSIKLDLVSTVNSMFDFPGSLLYPKVERSNLLSLTTNTFTDVIRDFIKDKLPLTIQEEIIQIIMDTYFYELLYNIDYIKNEDYDLKEPLIADTNKWELDKKQQDFMRSICIENICSQVCEKMGNNINDLLLNDIIKEYSIFLRVNSYSPVTYPNVNLLNLSKYLLIYNRTYSRNKNVKFLEGSYCQEISSHEIVKSAGIYGENVINNSDIYSRPRILPMQNTATFSSLFRESKPDGIISIDVSVKSTVLSFSLLDENGFAREVWKHNDFLTDKSLCSLGSFFSFSETTTLNVEPSFIEFAEEYLMGDVSFFSSEKNNALIKLNATKIETMLCKDSYTQDLLVSTQQRVYINAFSLLYMTYINYVISSKLLDIFGPNMEINIGYNITIEKMLLSHLFGSKEGLENLIYASGLLQKDDNSRKLRIITEGKRILHLLQRSLHLSFPLKSFFVLAQIHDNYVQLTLNQVVTEFILEEDQEAIITLDKIIHIPNIYTSLSLNMWNSIVEDNGLIKLCVKHQEYCGDDSLEILSSKNQAEFMGNFKRYISEDSTGNNSSQPATDKISIQLSVLCDCKVYLTVRDIIDISLRPVLRDIASLVSASFINRELFGKFWNIQYLFQLIHFDYNTRLHDYLIRILKETTEDTMIEQGVDIPYYVVPRSINQLLQPIIYQQPISYNEFQVGTLHHVYGSRYGFGFENPFSKGWLSYKSKKTDTGTISVQGKTVFPLFKKGDVINDFATDVIFYLNPQDKHNRLDLCINYFKLKMSCDLNPDGTVRFDDVRETFIGSYFKGLPKELKVGRDIPIVISIFYEAYSGSLTLRSRVAGQNIGTNELQRLGTPMYLCRF